MRNFSLRRFRLVQAPFFLLLGLASCGCGSRAEAPRVETSSTAPVKTALDDYIARDEPAYKWEKVTQRQIGKNDVTTLTVTSQTWQGIDWKHRVEIVRPEKIDFPGTAMVYLSTTDGPMESMMAQVFAGMIGATVVHVMGMPNQPLFGMREDDLIAHTFAKYVETGDKTWPLLLPMTKGAIKSIDAVQEYSKQQNQPLQKFIVTGASKRGWTTWLVGAADTKNRIAGIIPIVYDNLDLNKQLPHQFESWGEYSPMIADYTRRGLQQLLRTPAGNELTRIVDPYTYRSRFTMPKLIINGTNDPYWTTDALNLYWNDVPGPKNIYYSPNSGHQLEGNQENTFRTLAAWFKQVAGAKPVPQFNLTAETNKANGEARFILKADAGVSSAKLWGTHSASRDFRKAKWQAIPMQKDADGTFSANLPAGADAKNMAAFAEVEVPTENGGTLSVSTPIQILK